MNRFVFPLLGVSLVLAGSVWALTSEMKGEPEQENAVSSEVNLRQIERLNDQVVNLRKEIEQIRHESAAIANKPHVSSTPLHPPIRNEGNYADDPKRVSKAASRPIMTDQERLEQLDGIIGSEPANDSWLLDVHADVEDTLQKNKEVLAFPQIEETRCGESLCRMLVRLDSMASLERFANEFSLYPPWNTSGYYQVLEGAEIPSVVVYFTQKGEAFPEPSQP